MNSEEQEAEAVRLARQAAEADIMATADEREVAWSSKYGPLGRLLPRIVSRRSDKDEV